MDATEIFSYPIVPIFTTLVFLAIIFVFIGLCVKAAIIISPIKGFVIGALVHDDYYLESNQEVVEYTLQCLLGIISVNVIWKKRSG